MSHAEGGGADGRRTSADDGPCQDRACLVALVTIRAGALLQRRLLKQVLEQPHIGATELGGMGLEH